MKRQIDRKCFVLEICFSTDCEKKKIVNSFDGIRPITFRFYVNPKNRPLLFTATDRIQRGKLGAFEAQPNVRRSQIMLWRKFDGYNSLRNIHEGYKEHFSP